jgi:hypothetical protein
MKLFGFAAVEFCTRLNTSVAVGRNFDLCRHARRWKTDSTYQRAMSLYSRMQRGDVRDDLRASERLADKNANALSNFSITLTKKKPVERRLQYRRLGRSSNSIATIAPGVS